MPLKTQKSLLLPIMIQMDWRIFFFRKRLYISERFCRHNNCRFYCAFLWVQYEHKKSRTDVVFLLSTTTYKKKQILHKFYHSVCDMININGSPIVH